MDEDFAFPSTGVSGSGDSPDILAVRTESLDANSTLRPAGPRTSFTFRLIKIASDGTPPLCFFRRAEARSMSVQKANEECS